MNGRRRVAAGALTAARPRRAGWSLRLRGAIVRAYYWIVHRTSNRVVLGQRHLTQLHSRNAGRIYAIWHSCVFFGPSLGGFEPDSAAALVSSRGHGRLFATVIRALGHEVVLGSSSRLGKEAYRQLRRLLQKGTPVVLSPDGPRGPAFSIGRGLVELALRSGALIVPAHFESTRQIRRDTWDEQRIPLPLGTIVVSFGPPICVVGIDEQDKVEEALIRNRDRCRAICARLAARRSHGRKEQLSR